MTPTQPSDGELKNQLLAIKKGVMVNGRANYRYSDLEALITRREQRAALQARIDENRRLVDIQTRQERFGKAHLMHAVDYRNRIRELEAKLNALESVEAGDAK